MGVIIESTIFSLPISVYSRYVAYATGISASLSWDNLLKYTIPTPCEWQQGKSEGFDSCDRPSNLTQIGLKSSIFQPVWPWNLMDDPK